MADRFVFFRLLLGELAHAHGYFACFMPKPFNDRAGSGAHYNMSLADVNTGKTCSPTRPTAEASLCRRSLISSSLVS